MKRAETPLNDARTPGSPSQNKGASLVKDRPDPKAADVFCERLPEPIHKDTIECGVDRLGQCRVKSKVVPLTQDALENGLLDAMSEALADLCDSTKPSFSFMRLRVHVICHEAFHRYRPMVRKGK